MQKYSVSDLLRAVLCDEEIPQRGERDSDAGSASVICLAVTMNTFYQMNPDRYVSRKLYRDVVGEQNRQAVKEALKDDDGYYRTEQMGSDDENAADLNRIWDVDQNITSIYSSAYNPDYQTFRQKIFRLEEPFRNGMMQSVSKNPVFQRMMGVRYIVSDSDVPGYTLVKKCGTTVYIRIKTQHGHVCNRSCDDGRGI